MKLYEISDLSQPIFPSSSEAKIALKRHQFSKFPKRNHFPQSVLQPILTLSFPRFEQSFLLLATVGSLKFYDLIFDTDCPFSKALNLLPQHNILQPIQTKYSKTPKQRYKAASLQVIHAVTTPLFRAALFPCPQSNWVISLFSSQLIL